MPRGIPGSGPNARTGRKVAAKKRAAKKTSTRKTTTNARGLRTGVRARKAA